MTHGKLSFVLILVLLVPILLNSAFAQSSSTSNSVAQSASNSTGVFQAIANTEGKKQIINIPIEEILFKFTPHLKADGELTAIDLDLRPDLDQFYKEVGFFDKPQTTVVVYPIFTQAAYSENGFYDYYNKKCDLKCLTVNIPSKIVGKYSASEGATAVLSLLKYAFISDIDVDQNPEILKKYNRVIILHNEYVTKTEFYAITHHPNVIFLYPNALYAEVQANYTDNTITLVRGHGYPESNIRNGFDWKDDNSKYEYNVQCNNWTFYGVDNYSMMNCYPDYRILYSPEMLILMQKNDPTELIDDTSNWLRLDNPYDTKALLADYDINGTFIPGWVENPAGMLLNGDITRYEFFNLLNYLHEKNIIR